MLSLTCNLSPEQLLNCPYDNPPLFLTYRQPLLLMTTLLLWISWLFLAMVTNKAWMRSVIWLYRMYSMTRLSLSAYNNFLTHLENTPKEPFYASIRSSWTHLDCISYHSSIPSIMFTFRWIDVIFICIWVMPILNDNTFALWFLVHSCT